METAGTRRETDGRGPFRLYAILLSDNDSLVDAVESFLRAKRRPVISKFSSVLLEMLEQLGRNAVQTVIVEDGYFDLDCRSEDSVLVERQFTFERPLTLRLHFFAGAVERDEFRQWQVWGSPHRPESTRHHLSDLRVGTESPYLGYIIPRCRRGIVTAGRSLILPPSTHPRLQSTEDFGRRVRTRTRESVNLAGVSLVARGVPFMQQDGALLSCAHVTAWMAHFTAVLQGFATRVPVGRISATTGSAARFGRQYPTPGLRDEQVLSSLCAAGLEPEIMFVHDLLNPSDGVEPTPEWFHRPEIHERGPLHSWGVETLTTTIARYLNSGFPVIFSRADHTQLICGYLRNHELDTEPTDGSVAAFVAHDEGLGPYQVIDLAEFIHESEDATLIVPLPWGLALSGSDAEALGAEVFRRQCDALIRDTAALEQKRLGAMTVRNVVEVRAQMHNHELALRSYACWASDFKRSLQQRSSSTDLIRKLSSARLPRFIWVVEVIDRARRAERESPVVGEVIIDGTATSFDLAPELAVRVPGHVSVRDPVTGTEEGLLLEASLHDSGRWAQDIANPMWYGSTENRWKALGTGR